MVTLTTDNLTKILKANNESLLKTSRTDLKQALKENNEFIFKRVDKTFKENNQILFKRIDKIVHDRLSEASDAILHTIDLNHDEANQKSDQLSKDIADVKQDIKFIHQDIKDLNVDFSDKPSRKQFEEFKSKFDNYPTL